METFSAMQRRKKRRGCQHVVLFPSKRTDHWTLTVPHYVRLIATWPQNLATQLHGSTGAVPTSCARISASDFVATIWTFKGCFMEIPESSGLGRLFAR